MDPSVMTIKIFKNVRPAEGLTIHFRKTQSTFTQFLECCSNGLKINAQRVFNTVGDDIISLEQLQQDKDYYISSGEQFMLPIRDDKSYLQTRPSYQSSLMLDKISLYPLVVMGAAAIGKSNVTLRYVKNETYENYDPTLQDVYQKKSTIDDKQCLVKITDTCGQENLISLRTQWMKDKEGIIFIYAINSRESFIDLLDLVLLFNSIDKGILKPAVLVIVGNKLDLEGQRQVTYEEGSQLAQKNKALFFETSAKTGMNVDTVFVTLIREINVQREIIDKRRIAMSRLSRGNDDNDQGCSCQKCNLF